MISRINKSVNIDGLFFPGYKDYLQYFNSESLDKFPSLCSNHSKVISIQKDWHTRGQNGCIFAMHAARILSEEQWISLVCDRSPDANYIKILIENAVENPNNMLLSLIFPDIRTSDQLYVLINIAINAGCVLHEENIDGTNLLGLRWLIGDIESWVLGFAPIEELPETRRAPFTELVFRTKVKTKVLHPDLNNLSSQAHVADLDLGFNKNVMDRFIKQSSDRTTKILGGVKARDEYRSAKAKVTYGLKK